MGAMRLPQVLAIVGMVIQLFGGGIGWYGLRVSPQQAAELAVSPVGDAENPMNNLTLPMARNLLAQNRSASWAFAVIAVGTLLQIAALFLERRQ
jgi:hypothetical protein